MIPIKRTDIRLKADSRKVIIKPLNYGDPTRLEPVTRYVFGLSDLEAGKKLSMEDLARYEIAIERVKGVA